MSGGAIKAGILARSQEASIAYRSVDGTGPTIVFVHGFHSDMEGGKALALQDWACRSGRAFLRFDLFGHGQSSGRVEDGTIGGWVEDVKAVLDHLTQGPVILVGSSLGGWLSLIVARDRKDQVQALVGIAAAPDFTEDLMWQAFTPAQKDEMARTGAVVLPNCYDPDHPWTIPARLIEESRAHLLLRSDLDILCPVRLIQGQHDADVPWKTALTIAQRITGTDVRVHLIKDGDHRLSRDQDLDVLLQVVAGL